MLARLLLAALLLWSASHVADFWVASPEWVVKYDDSWRKK